LSPAPIIRQIALAVDHCAKQGVAHRDVKPDNILLDEAGRVFLTDFGIATELDDEAAWASPIGALSYLSPEMLGNSEGASRLYSDQFSLGVTLYQFMTGFLPFDPADSSGSGADRTVRCTASRIRARQKPVSCTVHDSAIPQAADLVFSRMLHPDARRRYPDCVQACEELIHALGPWELSYLNVKGRDDSTTGSSKPLTTYVWREAAEWFYLTAADLVIDLADLRAGTYVPQHYRLDTENDPTDQEDPPDRI
jgi:serine/threonine protein kinase